MKGADKSWLEDERMLPEKFPLARILRFGYDSMWRGPNPVRISVEEIAEHLLSDIVEARKVCRLLKLYKIESSNLSHFRDVRIDL